MYETLFADILNPDHELLRAARIIDWDGLHEVLSGYYSPLGRQGKSITGMGKGWVKDGASKRAKLYSSA